GTYARARKSDGLSETRRTITASAIAAASLFRPTAKPWPREVGTGGFGFMTWPAARNAPGSRAGIKGASSAWPFLPMASAWPRPDRTPRCWSGMSPAEENHESSKDQHTGANGVLQGGFQNQP